MITLLDRECVRDVAVRVDHVVVLQRLGIRDGDPAVRATFAAMNTAPICCSTIVENAVASSPRYTPIALDYVDRASRIVVVLLASFSILHGPRGFVVVDVACVEDIHAILQQQWLQL